MRNLFLLIPLVFVLTGATNINHLVEIKAEWKTCEVDNDCVQIDKSCNSCGGADVISKASLMEFGEEHSRLCKGYRGAFCNSALTPDAVVSCREHICVFGTGNK